MSQTSAVMRAIRICAVCRWMNSRCQCCLPNLMGSQLDILVFCTATPATHNATCPNTVIIIAGFACLAQICTGTIAGTIKLIQLHEFLVRHGTLQTTGKTKTGPATCQPWLISIPITTQQLCCMCCMYLVWLQTFTYLNQPNFFSLRPSKTLQFH